MNGAWSDSDEDAKNEACLMAGTSKEVHLETNLYNDDTLSLDSLDLDNEYDKICKMSQKIILKNKSLKSIKHKLEKENLYIKDKLSRLEKGKEIDLECKTCLSLKIKNEELKEEASKLDKFEKSTHSLKQIIDAQKFSDNKTGIGYSFFEGSTSGTKEIKFMKPQATDDGPLSLKDGPPGKGPSPVGESEKIPKSVLGPLPKTTKCNEF